MNIAKFLRKPIYSEEEVQMAASECFHFRWLLNDVNLFFLWGSFYNKTMNARGVLSTLANINDDALKFKVEIPTSLARSFP